MNDTICWLVLALAWLWLSHLQTLIYKGLLGLLPTYLSTYREESGGALSLSVPNVHRELGSFASLPLDVELALSSKV